ncbi:GtrA family protein [Domibacillus antri]|nr:GtrA family protein [Domibacillus antri]
MNTCNYYVMYLLLHSAAGLTYIVSHLTAFFVSMILSFFLHSYITYRVKPTLSAFFAFPLTQLFNVTVSSLVMYVFIEYLHMNSTMAPIIAVAAAVPVTFIVTGKIFKKERVTG